MALKNEVFLKNKNQKDQKENNNKNSPIFCQSITLLGQFATVCCFINTYCIIRAKISQCLRGSQTISITLLGQPYNTFGQGYNTFGTTL